MKRAGFMQSLYSTSNTRKEIVGTYRMDQYGRGFRYARAGAAALNPGFLGVGYAINAAHINEAILTAVAAGTETLQLTVTAGSAILENELMGGMFQINDATGEGHTYMIRSNDALLVGGTTINISLDRGIVVALDTTSEFTLVHSNWNDVVESTTVLPACGAPMLAVAISYYYWAQTHGPGGCYTHATSAEGSAMEQSADTAGYVDVQDTAATEENVCVQIGTDGVNAEFKPVHWTID